MEFCVTCIASLVGEDESLKETAATTDLGFSGIEPYFLMSLPVNNNLSTN